MSCVLAVDGVAVDVQVGREVVVGTDLLELLVRRADTIVGSMQPDARPWCRSRPAAGSAVGLGRGRSSRCTLTLVDAVRRARRLDVALDVRRLLGPLVRLDLELLDDRRVDAADERCADSTSRPTPTPGSSQVRRHDVGEEQQRADHRDDREDRLGRQHGVDVGVGAARCSPHARCGSPSPRARSGRASRRPP